MKNKRDFLIASGIFFFAFLLRFLYMLFLERNYFFYNHPADDVLYYQTWADDIARGNWLGADVFYGMPLYPYFLSVLKKISFGAETIVRIFHLLLGSLNCALIYLLAQKLFSRSTALLAGLLAATNFMLVYYDWLRLPVVLIIFLSLIATLVLLQLNLSSRKRDWFYSGIILGMGALCDGKFLIYSIFLLLTLAVWRRNHFRMAARRILLPMMCGILLVTFTVTLRNKIVGRDWVFISAHSGINFYLGNNPHADGSFDNPFFLRPFHQGHIDDPKIIAQTSLQKTLAPSQVSRFWSQKAIEFIRGAPEQYARLLWKKLVLFFREDEGSFDIDLLLQKPYKKWLDVNSLRIIVPLALLGMALAVRARQKNSVFLILFIASQLIFTLLFFLINRHRATILPFLIISQSYAVVWFTQQIKKQRKSAAMIFCLCFFALFLLLKPKYVKPELIEFIRSTNEGVIYGEQKDYKKAQESYRRALRLQPFDVTALYNLGNAYLAANDPLAAIEVYKKARRINPLDVDVLFNLATAYEQTQNVPAAVELYQTVIALSPQSVDAHFRLAEIFKNQGDCQQAFSHYMEILNRRPQLTGEINQLIANCKMK